MKRSISCRIGDCCRGPARFVDRSRSGSQIVFFGQFMIDAEDAVPVVVRVGHGYADGPNGNQDTVDYLIHRIVVGDDLATFLSVTQVF